MRKMEGELIGKDYFVNFKKDNTIIFNKWESGDYDWQTGKPKEDSTRLRTPLNYRKKLKPNTKYRITPSINVTYGLRVYTAEGNFLGTFSSNDLTNRVFTSPSKADYGLIMVITKDTSIIVKVEEVK